MSKPIASREPATILLVEDDHLVREACKDQMVESGYVVLEADSLRAAKAILRHHHTIVDHVVCDSLLPDSEHSQNIRHICDVLNLNCILVQAPSDYSELLSSLADR